MRRAYYMIVRAALSVCAIALLVAPKATGQGDAFLVSKRSVQVWTHLGFGSTRTYFSVDGIQRNLDTNGTTFSAYSTGLTADVGLFNDLEANFSLPIGYYRLTSEKRFQDRSILAPVWFGVGVTYRPIDEQFKTALTTQLRIPPGFHDGIYDDPNHPTFLSDGYMQLLIGLAVAYTGEGFWTKGGITYNLRGEEPVDQIEYHAEVGFSRIEGTGITLNINGVHATEDASNPQRPFYAGSSAPPEAGEVVLDGGTGAFRTIDRENYIEVRPGAFVDVSSQLTLAAQYGVRITGTNALRLNTFFVSAGYRFSL